MCSSTNLRFTSASNIIPQVISAIRGHLHSGNYFWKKLLLDAKGQRPLQLKVKHWLLVGLDPHSLWKSIWSFNSVSKDFDNTAFGIFLSLVIFCQVLLVFTHGFVCVLVREWNCTQDLVSSTSTVTFLNLYSVSNLVLLFCPLKEDSHFML